MIGARNLGAELPRQSERAIDADAGEPVLETTGGTFRLRDYRLRQGPREWSVLHTGAVLTEKDETHAIVLKTNRLPYGVSLWPSAIALAHEIGGREREFAGRGVLELGAGTGLPGIVAASLGARVVQTDNDELVLHLCERNGRRNGELAIEYRLADWTEWTEPERYDWVIGADILYGEALHGHLRTIFETNLTPLGRVLVADPFRGMGFGFMERLEADGWGVTFTKWDIGEDSSSRPMGVFELRRPGWGTRSS